MRRKENNETPKEKRVYDLRKVLMETRIEEFEEVDLSKVVANNVHRQVRDIGLDELSRELWREGRVALSQSEAHIFLQLINSENCDMNIAAVQAVAKVLTQ